MKWETFDYSKFQIQNGVEYFVYVHNLSTNSKYYHHIQGRNDTFYMTNSDADIKFSWGYNNHRILYIMVLPKPTVFQSIMRKIKIANLFKV